MQSPFALEVYANDLIRERRYQATQDALAAQLPRTAFPRPDLAARLQLANSLRALAVRLDPCADIEPSFLAMN